MKYLNRMVKIILASKSKVRKEILDKNNIISRVEPSNVDEDVIKKSLIKNKASPEVISKTAAPKGPPVFSRIFRSVRSSTKRI